MILVAVVVHLIEEYCTLVVRLLELAVRQAPLLSRRVRQIILRRLLTDPLQT